MDINKVIKSAQDKCKIEYGKELSNALAWQLHNSLSESIREEIGGKWQELKIMSDIFINSEIQRPPKPYNNNNCPPGHYVSI